MLIFSNTPGTVAISDGGITAVFSVVNIIGGVSFSTHKTIVTGIQASENVGIQLQHMFGGKIHVTTFSDKVGRMTLSGISFVDTCGSSSYVHGIESLKEWYDANKISVRSRPVKLVLGITTAFDCMIHSFTFAITDTSTQMANWTMELYFV